MAVLLWQLTRVGSAPWHSNSVHTSVLVKHKSLDTCRIRTEHMHVCVCVIRMCMYAHMHTCAHMHAPIFTYMYTPYITHNYVHT